MAKLFQLSGTATIFWDPTQSQEENQKLLVGQRKALEETEEVKKALAFNYLRVVSKGELEEETQDLPNETEQKETDEKSKKK